MYVRRHAKDVMKKGVILLFLTGAITLPAGALDTNDLHIIGVTVLRQVDPTLTGSSVQVAQPEASGAGASDFEVNPAYVGQPVSLFTYISTNGAVATGFPNSAGTNSVHADQVGENFYGFPSGADPNGGAATNVSHVDNYDANYFLGYIQYDQALLHPVRVVNQSFSLGVDDPTWDQYYDNYAVSNQTIFLSGVANFSGIGPNSPASCYNGIAVGAYGAASVSGPTSDGRCKPDITAPDYAEEGSGATSYSTPYVSGSAAILVQAANRRDGGANTNAASDLRTIKALLLNGAIKPNGWTNGTASPLDARYGAGVVNVFNSWEQLKGGQHAFIESTTNSSGGAHPPGANTNNEPVLAGWDYNTNSTTTTSDTVKHYYFNLPVGNSFTLTATLVWNKQYKADQHQQFESVSVQRGQQQSRHVQHEHGGQRRTHFSAGFAGGPIRFAGVEKRERHPGFRG